MAKNPLDTEELRKKYEDGGWRKLGISYELFLEHQDETLAHINFEDPPKELQERTLKRIIEVTTIETKLGQNCDISDFDYSKWAIIDNYVDHLESPKKHVYKGRFPRKDGSTLVVKASKNDFDIFHPFRSRYQGNVYIERGIDMENIKVKSESDLYIFFTLLNKLC